VPDGRVELQVAGAESEVFAFLDSIMESELRSHIDKQTRAALAEPLKARGFDIRHD
jgi:acylphosphatase